MPGPGWRKCTAYRQTGPGGLPLALRLNEGLALNCASEGGIFFSVCEELRVLS